MENNNSYLHISKREVARIYAEKLRKKGSHLSNDKIKDQCTGWLNAMQYFFHLNNCISDTNNINIDNDTIKKIETIDQIIGELSNIRAKIYNGEEVGNGDWVKPASILRDNIAMFMYNNPEKS